MTARCASVKGVTRQIAGAVARLKAGFGAHASAKETKKDIRLITSAHAKKPKDHEKHKTYDAHTAEYFG
jgi:hypothetical protein